jgi:cbb3-type cytochrome oxidase subunit 1
MENDFLKSLKKMKFIIALILTALLSFAGALFFPWWIIAVTSFIVAFFVHQKTYKAFLSGFLALFALWGLQSFFIDQANDHLLATKIASVLPLGGSYLVLILVTAFIGALVAGMAALSGSLGRSLLRTKN